MEKASNRFPVRDHVVISSLDWNFLWQAPQEVAARLGKVGGRVFYVENTGIRAPGRHDFPRILARLRAWLRSRREGGIRQVSEGVYVVSPLVLPPSGGPISRWINRNLLLPRIHRAYLKLGITAPVVWTFLPTDTALDLFKITRDEALLKIYYCLADFPLLALEVGDEGLRKRIIQKEREVVSRSDLVFAFRPELTEKFSKWSPYAFTVPIGVDLELFRPNERPQDNKETIIGYIGGLHQHINYDMLVRMATSKPHWQWIFVGPIQTDVGRLADLANVHLMGSVPHDELKEHIYKFDVCICPYMTTPYGNTLIPVKIYEYLACGKKVVATDLPTVREFNDRHHVLHISEADPTSFLSAIERALAAPDSGEQREQRRTAAAEASWTHRLEEMLELIEFRLTGGEPPSSA